MNRPTEIAKFGPVSLTRVLLSFLRTQRQLDANVLFATENNEKKTNFYRLE